MEPRIVARLEAAAAHQIRSLGKPASGHKHFRAYGVFRPLRTAFKRKFNPMIVVLIDVAKKDRMCVEAIDNDVDLAIIEEISKRRPARRNDVGQAGIVHRWHQFEVLPVAIVE